MPPYGTYLTASSSRFYRLTGRYKGDGAHLSLTEGTSRRVVLREAAIARMIGSELPWIRVAGDRQGECVVSAAVERLTKLAQSEDRFAISHADLRDAQAEAMNERFQDRKDRIKLLGHRAKEGSISEIGSREDIVPLLFPHSVYKSYPESFLTEQKWDRLGKWLGTISPHPIAAIETSDIDDIDEWIARLEAKGHYVSASSGTTGK